MPPNTTDRELHVGTDPGTQPLCFTPGATQSVSTELVMGVARASGIDPTQLHQALHEVINPSALDALFTATAGTSRSHGTVRFSFHGYRVSVAADGTITLQSELDRLKQTGVNILVCGAVPDTIRDELSTRLLGDAARDRDRTVLFAVSDRPPQTALQRLTDAQIPQQRAHILSTDDPARSAATQPPTTESGATMSTVDGTLDDVHTAVLQTLADLEAHHDGFAPAELRFCFDSLRPFIDTDDQERLTAVLAQLCAAVNQRDGMGQFLLPYALDSPEVQTVRSCFDVVVELRVSEQGPEYRWHLHTTDFTTPWLSL